jgi:flagellar biosynthesis/type III secretory pathway chaperone
MQDPQVSDKQLLSALLAEQIRCAEAMLGALTRESEALAGADYETLAFATDEKTKLIDALERLEAERRALVEPNAVTHAAERQHLRDLIARCKEQNERNGALLKARAENVRVALRALRGGDAELYGAKGRAPARTDARPLGTA